ncbi:Guanine nucleotide exchange factor MSS4 -like protein [Sarcoptes scabiei]|uniref:Guanine nucleotide exchange factor MSS4 -like protein n=1 Tax=Sarcoptes scabiei TaxID=52283 RepID=A0A834R8E6_SARSC|nr:Guanine nucleotide exchange factor MSS4 -like protein [Sarcoptes scabiei]UXI18943.1 uncharacterized protein NH340_JMT04886 [Sarcoptes scabiei]
MAEPEEICEDPPLKFEVNDAGKNAINVYCKIPGCKSLVFLADCALLEQYERVLPIDKTETLVKRFWRIDNMYQFENVSFTQEADTKDGKIKYLACCDCEYGPIGFQDLDTKICYVACDRVCYADCSSR